MALNLILLLSTLTLVKSTPNMFVSVSGKLNYDGSNPTVHVHLAGEDRAIATYKERYQFQLSDNGLKNCIRIYHGQSPTDAYVHSPTPWGDLYRTYGWRELHRIVTPLKATIQSISTKQEIISHKLYKNFQLTPGTGKATISRTRENRLTTTWSEGGEFTVSGEVGMHVNFLVGDIGLSASMTKSKSWGQADDYSEATAIADAAEIEFVIPPKSSVYVNSEISTTLVRVKVEYAVRLEGDTAINYRYTFKGHHFYGLDINNVMRGCGLPTEIIVTENITLDMITGAKLQVEDGPSLNS